MHFLQLFVCMKLIWLYETHFFLYETQFFGMKITFYFNISQKPIIIKGEPLLMHLVGKQQWARSDEKQIKHWSRALVILVHLLLIKKNPISLGQDVNKKDKGKTTTTPKPSKPHRVHLVSSIGVNAPAVVAIRVDSSSTLLFHVLLPLSIESVRQENSKSSTIYPRTVDEKCLLTPANGNPFVRRFSSKF